MNVTLLFVCLMGAGPLADSGTTDLHYIGKLEQVDRNGTSQTVREFQVECLVAPAGEGHEVTYLVDDTSDVIPWPARFGRMLVDAQGSTTAGGPITEFHKHEAHVYPLVMSGPMFTGRQNLAADAEWNEERLEYKVASTKKSGEHDCWVVEVVTGIGRSGTILVDKQQGVVVSSTQRVFMGQGERYELSFKLDSATPVAATDLERISKPLARLLSLQTKLERQIPTPESLLTLEQLEIITGELEALQAESADTPFERLTALISRDVKSQSDRTKSISELADRFVGNAAPEFTLKSLSGQPINKPRAGTITVLHFWTYRDNQLEEPYGQIGYLDFLQSKLKDKGVTVYGVAVDPKLADPTTAAPVIRSINKLREFMNLSYEITLDGGDLIESFGDPRQYNAALPLWVVIGPDGKISHYQTGLYQVEPNEGLSELDAVIRKLSQAESP